ncbi:MAG: hypothetical protein E7036_09700 [Opitutales bacterium]|nr:hypothetical protein [Opitutales bacterium]
MKKYIIKKVIRLILLLLPVFLFGCNSSKICEVKKPVSNTGAEYDVAVYVWPAFQPSADWKKYDLFKKGIGEWEFVKEAEKKRPWHKQPLEPLWGYEPEDNPVVIARKIDACLAAGVNVMIYDWYWYDHAPFLEGGLQAFIKAPNSYRMKFAIMWANHNIDDLWDKTVRYKCKDPNGYRNIRAKARVSLDEFKNVLVPRWIEFFKKPNYYKINGKPVFQIFNASTPVDYFGSKEATTEAFKYFEQKVIEAGFAGLELQGNGSYLRYSKEKFDTIGYDGAFYYNWLSLEPFSGSYYLDYSNRPDMDYKEWGEKAYKNFDGYVKKFSQYQFYPNVTCGWDTNPRFPADVYTPVALNNTPERFEYFLRKAKDWADKNIAPNKPKLILINALNEWTEGAYIEPDTENGYGFLNAISNVFRPTAK